MIKDIASEGYVVGIDASEGMISKAKEYTIPNLEFMLLNIDDILFENTFSIIISNAALHWVRDHQKLLSNCYRALKAYGVLRFNFAGDGNCSNFYKVIKSIIETNSYKKYFNNFMALVYAWKTGVREID
jgi:trans-aconitate 2-methyltransferase